jgi:hypothetical protein
MNEILHRWGSRAVSGSMMTGYAALMLLAAPLWVARVAAQVVPNGDFDICDYCESLEGNKVRVTGRAGFGTNRAIVRLINAAVEEDDVDQDGYAPGIDFNNLRVSDTTDFISVDDPARVIPRSRFVLADALLPLLSGSSLPVTFLVDIPDGTRAGLYRGRIAFDDLVNVPGRNPIGKPIRTDAFEIEIEVLPNRGLGLVQADTAAQLDSLTLRGRAGQTVNGVVRIANLGNVDLQNATIEATDLVATSGTGLRIPSTRISFSPSNLATIGVGDTARVVVTVRIPSGILAGAYRGDLIVQADQVEARRIPLTVIVTTPGDIVFENNPVVGREGDNAVVIFNADAGSTWQLMIFDMLGLSTFRATGTVFEGGSGFPGDEAVRYTWPLVNGRGENVAGGMYYVVVTAVQEGRERQLRGKLMVIR